MHDYKGGDNSSKKTLFSLKYKRTGKYEYFFSLSRQGRGVILTEEHREGDDVNKP